MIEQIKGDLYGLPPSFVMQLFRPIARAKERRTSLLRVLRDEAHRQAGEMPGHQPANGAMQWEARAGDESRRGASARVISAHLDVSLDVFDSTDDHAG